MTVNTIIAVSIFTIGTVLAQTGGEDFSSGIGNFVGLNNTTVNTTSGALEFSNSQDQGAGVTIDLNTAGVLGTDFVNLPTVDETLTPQSIFFQFTTIVPSGSTAQDELGFFFGPPTNQAQTSDITNGNNTNGFTIFFNDGGLFAQNNGQGEQSDANNGSVNILSDLQEGSEITLNIEWFLVEAQNDGQFNNAFTVTADGIDTDQNAVSATDTFDGAQNQGATQINNFQFTASTTQGLTGTLDDFTVSTEPIPDPIPEPSAVLLTGLGALALISRRKRA